VLGLEDDAEGSRIGIVRRKALYRPTLTVRLGYR
jgi:hypothetical protein